ncbi:hypothetical protein J2X97_003178 [Epilithonimonas hungarica]|uniref:DUF5689 domain-containing protein n=1 Tax=Epilithonimonas hungarica TaxID=454006 RepID=UPI0012D02D8A|nr:DUF5689 domain-containing protein [Epilithonimonas hungarica]MDP9957509.1 hypothetical protein [Epilithonimonas hungarica]MPT31412.1 hypothetical protein [Chryseobacterium sp.]
MNIKKYFTISLGVVAVAATQISCVHDDNWDAPEITCNNKFDAPTKTMAEVVAMAPATTAGTGAVYTIPAEGAPVIFDAYVVSSDENGNFYKTISFQDKPENPTVGLQIGINKSMNYADFPVGAHVRIKANGLLIGKFTGVVQLGIKDPNYTLGRIPQSIIGRYLSGVCDGNGIEIAELVPTVVTLDKIHDDKYINTLVQVKNVSFDDSAIGKGLMDKDASGTAIDTNRKILDASGNSAIIRTDGFFRTPYTIPNKSGDITFVVSKYCTSVNGCTYSPTNDPYQNIIRSVSDLNLTLPRTDSAPPLGGTAISYLGAFTENFESYAANLNTFPKYVNDASIGSKYWQVTSFSGNKYIQMTSYAGSGSTTNTTYFIVPILFTGSTKLSFKTKDGYTVGGSPLKVYYTTSYTPSSEVDTTKLIDITSNFTISKDHVGTYGTDFINSGIFTFPSSTSGNGYIFFSYEGNPNLTTTMQIDDIVVSQ